MLLLDHGAHGFEHGVAEVRLIGFLILDQVADTHLIPPGERSSELLQKHLPGREYMPKGRCKESEKGWDRRDFSAQIGHGRLGQEVTYRGSSESAAKTKYEEFHSAVGTVPRGRAVTTML